MKEIAPLCISALCKAKNFLDPTPRPAVRRCRLWRTIGNFYNWHEKLRHGISTFQYGPTVAREKTDLQFCLVHTLQLCPHTLATGIHSITYST